MASTGTGASRRSHTKSRKGCKTCKRRHIRCDESFPQCRNCSKHQVRCDYMDFLASEEPRGDHPVPDLFWSPEIENILEHWQRSGRCTLGNFSIDLNAGGHSYSKSDLHLIYHALWSGNHNVSNEFTVWTGKTPKFLQAATSEPFLVHAILGFGSLAVAWERNSTAAKALAYQHGGTALEGLQTAISAFSKENSDAVLAASVLLSWQANDWKSWASLIAGIRTVLNSMQEWKHESRLQNIMDEQELAIPQDLAVFHSPTVGEIAGPNYGAVLRQTHGSLETLQAYLTGRPDGMWIDQLKDYIQRLLAVKPAQSPEEQFNHLYTFRKWIFWIPATLLRSEARDYMTLVVLAYLYTTALSFEPLYPNVAPAFCSSMTLAPLEEIFKAFDGLRQNTAFPNREVESMLSLLGWPKQVASSYRSRKLQPPTLPSQGPPRISPVGFDVFSSNLANAYEEFRIGSQNSPAFAQSPVSRVSSELSSGSPYLEVPTLPGQSSGTGANYQRYGSLPGTSAGYQSEDPYGGQRSPVAYGGHRSSDPGPSAGEGT